MCEPVTTALFIASAASTAAQQSQQAKQQNKIAALNRENAVKSLGLEYQSLGAEERAEALRAAQSIAAVREEAMLARGRVGAAAAEAGVSGASVDAVLDDFTAQEGKHVTAVLQNERIATANIERRKKAAEIGTSGRLASSMDVQGPNLLGLALGAFADSYSTHLSIEAAKEK